MDLRITGTLINNYAASEAYVNKENYGYLILNSYFESDEFIKDLLKTLCSCNHKDKFIDLMCEKLILCLDSDETINEWLSYFNNIEFIMDLATFSRDTNFKIFDWNRETEEDFNELTKNEKYKFIYCIFKY